MKRNSTSVLWMSSAFAVAFALAVAVVALLGTDQKSIGVALRVTARWSFLLFWLAYAGKALAVLFGPTFAPLARRGREFGLAFAAAHLVHIGLIVWLYRILGHAPLTGSLFVFFMVGIGWTYLLAALSFGNLAKALGPTGWQMVRLLGMNYILFAFARDFVLVFAHSSVEHQKTSFLVEYAPFAIMSIAAPLLVSAASARRYWATRRIVA